MVMASPQGASMHFSTFPGNSMEHKNIEECSILARTTFDVAVIAGV